jgi:hypothetical protein
MSKHTEKGTAFELEVEKLFRLKGYAVRRNEQISGTQLDLVVQKSDLLENLCFVIECTDRAQPVGVDLLKQKAAVLLGLSDSRFLFRLIYVSRSGFTPDAKTYAQSCANILLLTLQDLESELIDFRTYADAYIDNFEHSRGMFSEGKLFNNYVELLKMNMTPYFRQSAQKHADGSMTLLTTCCLFWANTARGKPLLLGISYTKCFVTSFGTTGQPNSLQ